MAVIYLIYDFLKENKQIRIVLYVILAIIIFFLFIRFFSNFLRDVDYLQTSLLAHLVRFLKFIKFIILTAFKIIFFPIYLIKLIMENKEINCYLLNNSSEKGIF